MAGYWLKLYTEILDDPKYHRLSEQAKLGMIELMIVAKKHDKDGCLPCLDDICFYTRRSMDWWVKVMDELEKIYYIVKDDSGEKIRKFAERQQAVDPKERRKQARAKKQRDEYGHESSPIPSRKVTESRDRVEKEIEKEEEAEADAVDDSGVLTSFSRISGLPIPAIGAIRDTWLTELTALKAKGVTDAVMRRACQELTEKGGYRITSPKSIIKACDVVLAEKKRRDNSGYIPISSNSEYSEAVNR